ncbi:MAG TPA: response regulator [Alphaproteobacteria bacterium]|jgi:CheY-like chemotaxis protein
MASEHRTKPVIDIMLVEDNPADARLTREALRESGVPTRLHHVSDGEQALDFLNRCNGFDGSPRPDIILLDLNLPRMDGRDVLRELKSDPKLMTIPVVVLTTSEAEEDIIRSYELHANCYVQKPVDLDKFLAILGLIENFWLSTVRLPPAPPGA